jgi:AhpD family alkylhydroperoxidase
MAPKEKAPAEGPRLRYGHLAPEPYRLLSAIETYLKDCGLEPSLINLVWIRTSQINGCPFCLQMHSSEAVTSGERVERLFQLQAWQESPVFTDRERCALAWTDAVTLVNSSRVPDELFVRAQKEFPEKELVDLTWAVVEMNCWNRLSIAFRDPPDIPKQRSSA